MKYKRKHTPEIEAFFVEHNKGFEAMDSYKTPRWVKDYISSAGLNHIQINTDQGTLIGYLPSWFIREQNGEGCYPCSVEYFEKNFEEVM